MASWTLRGFVRQTSALARKNLIIILLRHPISTLFRAILLPIGFLILILELNTFFADNNRYGVGSPVPIQPLHGGLLQGKTLAFVVPPGRGPDVDAVVQQINSTLGDVSNQLVYLNNETNLLTTCRVNIHGVSGCFAALVFKDSPLSAGGSNAWSYTIRADPRRNGLPFNVFGQGNDEDNLWLPLQVAIENAITNSTDMPNSYMFTHTTQAEADLRGRQHFMELIISTYSVVLFIATLSAVYHIVAMITTERESGISQLIDVMGGNAAARVLSYVLVFDIIYLPCWIVSGICESP
jgi:hypothetical protein